MNLTVYINFDKTCQEAMTFYQSILGGELKITKVKDAEWAASAIPADLHDTVLHSTLTNGSVMLMATDCHMSEIVRGNATSLTLTCDTEEDAKRIFPLLSEGGEVTMPLEEQPFAALFGHTVDKFGISWVVAYGVRE